MFQPVMLVFGGDKIPTIQFLEVLFALSFREVTSIWDLIDEVPGQAGGGSFKEKKL